jgi:hypothetical protein
MSLIGILKTVGKDLSHLGSWIEDGLKIAEPIIGAIDPSLVPLIQALEDVLGLLPQPTTGALSAQHLQDIVTAVTAVTAIKNSGVISAATLAAALGGAIPVPAPNPTAPSTPVPPGTTTVNETATESVTATTAR